MRRNVRLLHLCVDLLIRVSTFVIVSAIMRMISDALESLQVVSGHHSFFLVVNPNDEADKGFLGGTTLGREFWRGHRGCGLAGAQAFKLFCQKATNPGFSNLIVTQVLQQPQSNAAPSVGVFPYPATTSTAMVANSHPNVPKKNQASVIKAEVYGSIRNAIRYMSLFSIRIILAFRFSRTKSSKPRLTQPLL